MDGGHPDDDDMEDDEDDMVDDDEMDFGDETGSDDTSNTDEEGDDDEEMDEPIPNENDWENEDDEEDEEDDLVHNEEEGGEDEDDEDDEDDGGEPGGGLDDEDAEILWQDMHGVNAEAPALGEDGDEDDEVAGRKLDDKLYDALTTHILQVPFTLFTRTRRMNRKWHLTRMSMFFLTSVLFTISWNVALGRTWMAQISLGASSDLRTVRAMVPEFSFLAVIAAQVYIS